MTKVQGEMVDRDMELMRLRERRWEEHGVNEME